MTYELKDGDKLIYWPPVLRAMGFSEEAIAALTQNLRWKEIEAVMGDVGRLLVQTEQCAERIKIDD
jgi:hypothetical protein